MSERVPEFSYRSADVYYEVHLPSWATRDDSVSLDLEWPSATELSTHLAIEDAAEKIDAAYLRSRIRKRRVLEPIEWCEEQDGEVMGATAVRVRIAGGFAFGQGVTPSPMIIDTLCLDSTTDQKHPQCAVLSAATEPSGAEAAPDLWEWTSRASFGPPSRPQAGRAILQLRGFGVPVQQAWGAGKVSLLSGDENLAPLVDSPMWGGKVYDVGYKVRWRISGPLDATRNAKNSRWHATVDDGETRLPTNELVVESSPALTALGLVEIAAVEHPPEMVDFGDGELVEVDDVRNRPRARRASGGIAVGGGRTVRLVLRVEERLFDRLAELWQELVNSIVIHEA